MSFVMMAKQEFLTALIFGHLLKKLLKHQKLNLLNIFMVETS